MASTGAPSGSWSSGSAADSGGTVRVLDDAGAVVAEGGRPPPRGAPTEALSRDLSVGRRRGPFELERPDGPQAPFVRGVQLGAAA